MKLFLISNASKFKGAVHVIYNAGKLIKVDFTNCDLDFTGIEKMLQVISSREEFVQMNFKSSGTVIIEGEFEITFEDFIREYPYKRNTHLAKEFWNSASKMKKEEKALAFIRATDYRKFLERPENSWQKPMIPDKWLKTKQYLNDWKTL